MKINMFKFYKAGIICLLTLGIIEIIGSIIFTAYYYTGNGIDDCIILFIAFPIGLVVALFPICISYRQLTYVLLDDTKCTSYSLLRKRLCEVDFKESVFYSEFYVKFAYKPRVKFIALSNEPFVCKQNSESAFEKKFYGAYNQNKIIIFPYDEHTSPLLNLDEWHAVN